MDQYEVIDHLVKQLNDMDSDTDRWTFIINNPDLFVVFVDNDDLYAKHVDEDREDHPYVQFDWHIGNADGLQYLATAIGITVEGV